jgi:hypothetical protein
MKNKKSLGYLVNRLQYKLGRIPIVLLEVLGNLPIFYKYQLVHRFTTFKEHCTEIESFPHDEETISKDWYLLIRSSEKIQRKLPICLDEDELALKKLKQYYYHDNPTHYQEVPEVFLSCTKKAKLIATENTRRGFFILSTEDYVFGDVLFNNKDFLTGNAFKVDALRTIMCPPFQPKFRHYPGEYCLLTTPMSPINYYHWMLDILPRLSLIEQFTEFENIPLILHKELTKFQKETLQLAGVSAERIVCLDNGYYQFDKLYYPSYLGMISSTTKHTASWYRTNFLKKFSSQESSTKDFVYISRGDANIRRVLNEEEIKEFLKSIGFEIITPGQVSLQEQIKTFINAKVIVSPHGAGLTNMVFAPPNTTVIEMFPESKNQVDGSYWTLADSCGHNYAFLTGSIPGQNTTDTERIISTGWDDKKDRDRDFYVPLDKLKALLEKVAGNLI